MRRVKEAVHYFCPDTLYKKIDGHGITTAVLDTGICAHPDLAGKITAFGDMISGKSHIYDDNSHGTHVAGIIAGDGTSSAGVYSGIAPGSNIVAVKVLDRKGEGRIKDLILGIRAVLQYRKKWNIRIVNISIGTLPHRGDEEETELLKWVEALWDAGIVVVTAAGNYGPGKGTVTLPGISKKVITVGASDDDGYYAPYSRVGTNYSGRGPTFECVRKPDLVALGSYITSCNAFYNKKGHKLYSIKSGTSMSTPIVSGAIALLLCKYPDMSNTEVKIRLMLSADDMGRKVNMQGHGLLNIEKLLTMEM
nr:S8 family peptidase [uncultured Sellimonas sp.]